MSTTDYLLFLFGLIVVAALLDRLWLDVLRQTPSKTRSKSCQSTRAS